MRRAANDEEVAEPASLARDQQGREHQHHDSDCQFQSIEIQGEENEEARGKTH